MRNEHLFLFFPFSFALFCVSMFSVSAKAPTTAKIVFAKGFIGETRDIYLMNSNGSEEVNLTNHRADDVSPVWSPTGEHILFASDREHKARGTWDLYLMDADGSNVRRVFDKPARRNTPAWSPDGKRIAYSYGEIGNTFLYIGTIDGKDEERVAIGYTPAWSPNGREIAFRSGALDQPRRFSLLKVQSKKQTFFPFPKEPMWVRGFAWSSSGNKVAFSWHIDGFGREAIYIVSRDGTGLQKIIGDAEVWANHPTWSAHDDEILYHHFDENEGLQIYKIGLEGGQPEQLTHTGWNYLGDWFDPSYALPVSPKPELLTASWGEVKRE